MLTKWAPIVQIHIAENPRSRQASFLAGAGEEMDSSLGIFCTPFKFARPFHQSPSQLDSYCTIFPTHVVLNRPALTRLTQKIGLLCMV